MKSLRDMEYDLKRKEKRVAVWERTGKVIASRHLTEYAYDSMEDVAV